MPPPLALALGYALVAWLLRQDMNWRTAGSKSLIVVGFFLAIIGSRPLSYWVGAGGGADGNPINTAFFGILLVFSLMVLNSRGLSWPSLIANNKTLFLLYAFFLASGAWSVEPGTSVKRLIKDFVCVLIALIIRTEADPVHACRTIFVRVAYVLFPLSLVFGKYFPAIGRSFSMGGEPMFTGVTTQKNSLGQICFVFGLFILWDLIDLIRGGAWKNARQRVKITAGVLMLAIWLLIACDSKTSLVCLIGSGVLLLTRNWFLRRPSGKPMLIAMLVCLMAVFALDNVFGVSETALRALNRNPTLTGRTDIWKVVLEQQHDPMLGGGFYIFWDSEKAKAVAKALVTLNSAHSGYIETYLDGGAVGCFVLGLFLLATAGAMVNRYFTDRAFAPVSLPIFITAVVYNLSETSYLRLDPLWFTLLLVSLEMPQIVAVRQRVASGRSYTQNPLPPKPVTADA